MAAALRISIASIRHDNTPAFGACSVRGFYQSANGISPGLQVTPSALTRGPRDITRHPVSAHARYAAVTIASKNLFVLTEAIVGVHIHRCPFKYHSNYDFS